MAAVQCGLPAPEAMTAYYNEIDPYAAQWLRNLIEAGHIAPGVVDERSIADIKPVELAGFVQCHFFAGIGGWSLALRMAGWPDARPVWTGSCPCQPFSLAGAQKGFDDDRHLWPVWRELIRERQPSKVFGEQVASAADWLRLVRGDLEALGYAVGAMPIQAASAGADHLRDRFWFVADADDEGLQGWELLPERSAERAARPDGVADTAGERGDGGEGAAGTPRRSGIEANGAASALADASGGRCDRQSEGQGQQPGRTETERPGDLDWIVGADGKARRVKPGLCLLAHGVPARVGKLRAFGNAIVPQVAAQFIRASVIE